jgi:hypothetical protein
MTQSQQEISNLDNKVGNSFLLMTQSQQEMCNLDNKASNSFFLMTQSQQKLDKVGIYRLVWIDF